MLKYFQCGHHLERGEHDMRDKCRFSQAVFDSDAEVDEKACNACAADEGQGDAGYVQNSEFVERTCAMEQACLEEGLRSRSEVASEAFGHDSVRDAYEELGAAGFYASKGASYVNPHEPRLSEALHIALDQWQEHLSSPLRALDLACGSGEATLALEAWLEKTQTGAMEPVLEAADPYTFEAFERRVGRRCHHWSFQDVADGVLEEEPIYDLVLCSFALHLLERSWLTCTVSSLARRARLLVVATPHKRPLIERKTGWEQVAEVLHARVRVRLYRSLVVDDIAY
ncbi:unnamed protein product [Durusdinium trenchii]|uniref:Methyltransferase domain-containing protein n=1 Tax=Durusdinium trenchii TaxID=1381693 RepID=A0ABP0P654_9DINO